MSIDLPCETQNTSTLILSVSVQPLPSQHAVGPRAFLRRNRQEQCIEGSAL